MKGYNEPNLAYLSYIFLEKEYKTMTISHEQYLKNVLLDAKGELKELDIVNRIRTREHNVESEYIQVQIESIEKQLESHKIPKPISTQQC